MEASDQTQPGEVTEDQPVDPAARPDDGTGSGVDPATPGDQGEQDPGVPISAPPAEDLSGVPDLPNGDNEGVEPQPENSGPTGDSGQSPEGAHPEANQTDGDPDAA